MVAIAPFRVEAADFGESFEQCGLAAPILADEEGDVAAQGEVDPRRERA
jgi:hypothetical protein